MRNALARVLFFWRSTSGRLVLLVSLSLVPVLAFTTVVVLDRARAEQREVEARLDGEARALARSIDDQIESMRTDLDVLGVAPTLLNDDFEGFHSYLVAVAERRGYIINLVAADRTFILSSAAPYGTQFSTKAAEDVVGPAFAGATYNLSTLGRGLLTNHPRALLAVPIYRGGVVVYVLTASIFSERVQNSIDRLRVPDGWTAAILDQDGTFIARSEEAETFLGRQATPGARAVMRDGQQGIARGGANNGTIVVASLRRSASGWWAVMSMSESTFAAPLRRSLLLVSLAALCAFALSIALAAVFASRIAGEIRSLANAAEALGLAQRVPKLNASLAEVGEVGRVLADASDKLRIGEARLRDSQTRLSLAHDVAQIGTLELEPDSRTMEWSPALFELHGRTAGASSPSMTEWLAMIHPADRQRVESLVGKAVRDEGAFSTDYRIETPSGETRWLAARGRMLPTASGMPRRLVCVNYDVTDRKLREERQALMVRELHHRVKNTLATVQAIIGSTARSVTDLDTFREAVIGRIASLARTHTLLTDTAWSEIALRELVEGELEPYRADADRVRVEGPPVVLTAETGLALGMVLHELSTNAAKYGALSVPTGRVLVGWEVESNDGAPVLVLRWFEDGGPPVSAPKKEGFGSRLMTRVLTHQLRAEIERDFADHGFKCVLRVPLTAPRDNAKAA